MPIDLYGSLKKTSQWAFGSPLLNGILSSSIFVAVVIALIMILLIMIMYPAKRGTSFSVVAKMFIYMFFASMLVIFLHDSVLKYMMEEEFESQSADNFMQNTTMEGRTADPAYGGLYRTMAPTKVERPVEPQRQEQQRTETPLERPSDEAPVLGGNVLPAYKPPRSGGNPYA